MRTWLSLRFMAMKFWKKNGSNPGFSFNSFVRSQYTLSLPPENIRKRNFWKGSKNKYQIKELYTCNLLFSLLIEGSAILWAYFCHQMKNSYCIRRRFRKNQDVTCNSYLRKNIRIDFLFSKNYQILFNNSVIVLSWFLV